MSTDKEAQQDDGAAGRAARLPLRGRSRPIATYLVVLALVALVPAFIFSAVLLARNNDAQSQLVETLVTGTSRSIVQAVEREIAGNITTLRVLAGAPALLSGDYRSFHTRVRLALEGTKSAVYLLDADLMTLMTTRTEFDETPHRPSADPESARQALAGGDVVVSGIIKGAVSGNLVVNVLLPVFPPAGRPLLLGLSRGADELSAALLSNKMPEGWNVALIDSRAMVVAASPGAASPGDAFTLADPRAAGSTVGWTSLHTAQGDYLAVVQRSQLSGWTLYAWAPRELIARPLANAFWSLLVGGILLAAVVLLIIYWVSIQIGRSVHGLEADARRLGAGEPVEARSYPITEIATVSESLADASRRRKAAETEVRLLMRELAHRSKNQMTVIAAMAKQSAKSAESVPDFVSAFEKRIYGLARSTDLLLANGIAGVDLRDVVGRQVDPLCPLESDRVELAGPSLKVNPQSAQILGMAAHELATNAAKYGAFATDTGTLSITWSVVDRRLHFTWRERFGAPAEPPRRKGFGTIVLETMVGRSLGADVTRTQLPDGLEWTFSIPLDALDVQAAPYEVETPAGRPIPVPPAPAAAEK